MYHVLDFFINFILPGLSFLLAHRLTGKSYKEIDMNVFLGVTLINAIYWTFIYSLWKSELVASTFFIKSILFIVSISQICKTDFMMSSTLSMIVSLLPTPIMFLPHFIFNQMPNIILDEPLVGFIYGIFNAIGVLMILFIYKYVFNVKIHKIVEKGIYKMRYVGAFLWFFILGFTTVNLSSTTNFSEILFKDFKILIITSMSIVAGLIFITLISRKAKQTIAMRYAKINEQQALIFSYYEKGMHLKHDYINILLSLRNAVDSGNNEVIEIQLEHIEKYTKEEILCL